MTVTKRSAIAGNVLAMDERQYREVIALSSGSTAITVSTGWSGKMIIVPGFTSGALLTLPAVGDGLNFEFYHVGGTASGVVTYAAAATGTIVCYGDAAADSITIGKATGAPSIGGSVRFVCDGTYWYTIMQPAFSSAAPTSATMTEYAIVS